MQGQLLGIFITENRSQPMTSLKSAQAVAERGIEGDRYFLAHGTFSKNIKKSRDITLIEIEAIWALKRDYNIDVQPQDIRRNLLTTGIALNHFVNRRLCIGSVIVEGIELCEPCGYLSDLLNLPLKEALKHRGGLRCKIISGGLLEIGQPILCIT
jgi:MOSC domain-containing protein YiiM